MTLMGVFLASLLSYLAICLLLRQANVPRQRRFRQWWSPLLALVFVALMVTLWYRLEMLEPWQALLQLAQQPGPWQALGQLLVELRDSLWQSTSLQQAQLDELMKLLNRNLNLAVLSLFLLAKVIMRALTASSKVIVKASVERPPASWFYLKVHDAAEARLRPGWTFSQQLLIRLAWLAFVLTLLHVVGLLETFAMGWGAGWSGLSLIVLAEMAWYLQGLPYRPEVITAADETPEVQAPKAVNFDELMADYQRRWPEWLLRQGKHQHLMPEYATSTKTLIAPDITDDAGRLLLASLLEGKSVLIEDVMAYRLHSSLAYYLRDLLVRGQRVLVLVNHEDQVEAARLWLTNMFSAESWSILNAGVPLADNPHILVATLRQHLFSHLSEPWAQDLRALIVLDAHDTAVWHGAEVDALIQAMSDTTGKPPQLIAMADWRLNAENTIRNILKIDVNEIQLGATIEQGHYMVWRLESPSDHTLSFQSRIFSPINTRLTPEISLSYQALGAEVDHVLLVEQQNTPYIEALNEADNAFSVGQLDPKLSSAGRLQAQLPAIANDWEMPALEGTVVALARDASYNLVATARKWLSVSQQGSLVHIISPPYLLRDYFVAHLPALLSERRRFSPLAPTSLSSSWSRAYTLYRRLQRGFVARSKVERALHSLGLKEQDVEQQLRELFREQLAMTHIDFSYQQQRCFNSRPAGQAEFSTEHYLKLDPQSRETLPSWHRLITIEGPERAYDGERKVLDRLYAGHLYQNYLEGQVHTFGGKPYQIDQIHEAEGRVQTVSTPLHDYRDHYRQYRIYKLDWEQRQLLQESRKKSASDQTQVTLRRYEMPLMVSTPSYLSFTPQVALDLHITEEYTLRRPPQRHYAHGKVLQVSLRPAADSLADPATVAFSLALLLNEMLLSYYPEAHPYLRICSPLIATPETAETSFLQRLYRLVPAIEGVPAHEISTIDLYIIEDSYFDLGGLSSLWHNLDHLLEDLLAYLLWFEQQGHEQTDFLNFGAPQVPEVLDLAAVKAVLEKIVFYRTKE